MNNQFWQSRLSRPFKLLALLVAFLPTLAWAADGDAYIVPVGTSVAGNIASVTQPIIIQGEVVGDVTSWSGDITVNGRVGGDVVSYTGRVVIASDAKVDGSVMSMGGGVERHALASIGIAELRPLGGSKMLSSLVGIVMPPSATIDSANAQIGRYVFGGLAGLLLLAFALLWGAIWPNRTMASGLALVAHPVAALIVGLLATVAAALVIPPLVGLLAASMIGMPLLAALIVIVHAPCVFGLAAFGRAVALWIGGSTIPMVAPPPATIAAVVLVALLVAVACAWSPLAGLCLFYLLAAPGLGAILLSRGGLLAPQLTT